MRVGEAGVVAVLAAGAGTRMGIPKAELVVDGRRLLDRAVATLRSAGVGRVVAVVRDGVQCAADHVVVNALPARGMRSSLALAVGAAVDAPWLAVTLVDVPGLGAPTVRAVVAAWRPGRIAVASPAGDGGGDGGSDCRARPRYGHPIVMSAQRWRAALQLAGPDEGARAYLAAHDQLVDSVRVTDDVETDLDTPADLARWTARTSPGQHS